jgi:hypothetical protein
MPSYSGARRTRSIPNVILYPTSLAEFHDAYFALLGEVARTMDVASGQSFTSTRKARSTSRCRQSPPAGLLGFDGGLVCAGVDFVFMIFRGGDS